MASFEWVEVRGPSVEKAVEAALAELGLSSPDEADVEVMQEPQRGSSASVVQDALVG
jgi:predicted RNA-binding protein Jag